VRPLLCLCIVAGLGAAELAGASPAGAAGDPTLDRLIITSPVPGLPPINPPSLSAAATNLEHEEQSTYGVTVRVALQGWGAAGGDIVVIALASFPAGIPAGGDTDSGQSVGRVCTGSGAGAPASVAAVADLPNSAEGLCIGATGSGQKDEAVVVWVKANVLGVVISIQLPTAQAASIALDQDQALPAGGVGKSGHTELLLILGGLAVVAVAAVLVLVARARRRATPFPAWFDSAGVGGQSPGGVPPWGVSAANGTWPPSPSRTSPPFPSAAPAPGAGSPGPFGSGQGQAPALPPTAPLPLPVGWYPTAGDPPRLGYWDGTAWVAWQIWDGAAWVTLA